MTTVLVGSNGWFGSDFMISYGVSKSSYLIVLFYLTESSGREDLLQRA
ncbi:hypothetical protein GALL_161460 [mine drainage metagenome]|uniref:Uncharacterized protein n=1 Tax=mine drainage metagenome TaxID=410659 RepID=A0A1J5SJF2_9ZZZZ